MTGPKSEASGTATAVPAEHADPVVAELGELLRTGPFETALRTAIRARRLSLERLQSRLRARGTPVSITALSYWQSGRRQPERPDSLLALAQLESVLGLRDGALSALLGPPRPRGRNRRPASETPPLSDLWAENASAVELLTQFDTSADGKLTRLSHHDLVHVDAHGDQRKVRARQLLRAERGGADRWVMLFDGSSGTPVSIRPIRGCHLGQALTDRARKVIVAELVFERPLDEGETLLLEYDVVGPTPGPSARDRTYCRLFRLPVRQYVLDLQFDPDAPPAWCESFVGDSAAQDVESPKPLSLDPRGRTHAIALDFGMGVFGARWQPAPQRTPSGSERTPALTEPR